MSTGDWIGVGVGYLICSFVVFAVCAIIADGSYPQDKERKWARLAFWLAPLGPFAFVVAVVAFIVMLPVWAAQGVKAVWEMGWDR